MWARQFLNRIQSTARVL